MAGCIARWRSTLFRHPSFWGEEDASQLPQHIVEDPRVVASEQIVHQNLAAQVTPFVASLDEATVNVGCFTGLEGASKESFKRLLADTMSAPTGYGWQERRLAYKRCDRLALGPERLVCEHDPAGAERRVSQRLMVARLEAVPALRAGLGSNSQFEAVSAALWATPSYHALLRQLAVEHMREHPTEFAWFLGRDFDAYLAAMARPGTPADELTLRAMADRLGIPVTLVTGDEFVWTVRYPPQRTTSQREVFLAAVAPCSYAAVRRQSTLSSIKQAIANGPEVKQARETRRRLTLECTTDGGAGGTSL